MNWNAFTIAVGIVVVAPLLYALSHVAWSLAFVAVDRVQAWAKAKRGKP